MSNKSTSKFVFSISVIGALFFVIGFITWSNSQLIPYLKTACQLTDTESYLVGTAFFAAYFFMAIPSSYILKWAGFKKGMVLALFIMSAGALLFIPAAQARNYPLFLTGLFLIGTGLALLQTAVNPYVTILGPLDSAAQRISIMGVCNKLAGIAAVYLLGYLFIKDIDSIEQSLVGMSAMEADVTLQNLADKVITPYIVIAIAFAILGVVLLMLKLPEVNEDEENAEVSEVKSSSVFAHKNLVLGALAIFVYVGAEVISYDAFSGFGESLGFSKKESSMFASYTGYAMIIGYFLTIFLVPRVIKQRPVIIISSILSIVFLGLALVTDGYIAVTFFALLGLSQSAMWPAIWPLALNGLGKYTKIGSAILIMMIVGGAIVMPMMGKFAEYLQFQMGMEGLQAKKLGFLIMIPCWLFMLYYAVSGYKSKYIETHS